MFLKNKLPESINKSLSAKTFTLCLAIYLLNINFYSNAQIHEKGTASGQTQEYVIINKDLNTVEVVEDADIKMISESTGGSPYQPLATTIFSEGFEGIFPGSWTLYGSPTWDDESYRSLTGSWSGYCAGTSISPPGPYATDMNAWMVAGPFDLSNASDAELLFNFWNISELNYDYFSCMVSIDNSQYYGTRWSGTYDSWNSVNFDLTDVYTLGNVCGQPEVWIAFIFTSDYIVTYEGAYVDDIELQVELAGDHDIALDDFWFDPPPPLPADQVDFEYLHLQITNEGDFTEDITTLDYSWTGPLGLTLQRELTLSELLIEFAPGETKELIVTINTPSAGLYDLTVTIPAVPGETDTDDNSRTEGSITVEDNITVTSPNGGENWQVGSSHDITWTSLGTSGNVRIEYSTDNGTNWTDISAGTTDDGTYPWIIPDEPSVNCLVRISDTDGDPTDVSDAVFTISVSEVHFHPVWEGTPGQDHMNFYAILARIEGVDMEAGDEIGIFDGDICVGAGVLTGVVTASEYLEIRVSRDDETTPEIDGYTVGNTASFILWDAGELLEISNVDINYISGDDIFTPSASTWYEIEGFMDIIQEIPLTAGWNIFSLCVSPDDINMVSIVQQLIDEGTLVKVQDELGASIELHPVIPDLWINNIGDWSINEGYKIRVNENTTLYVEGSPNRVPVDIDLRNGWNIIGYPACISQNALAALDDLISRGNLVKVQDELGAAIEPHPVIPDTWIDNIGDFEPGEGYKVRVSADETLTILPPEGSLLKSVRSDATQPVHHKTVWEGNGYDHMNIYLFDIELDGETLGLGDELGVFDGPLCVGAAAVTDASAEYISIVASVDDPTTDKIDGFIPGHTLSFRIWKATDEIEVQPAEVDYYKGYRNVFEPMGTTMANLRATSLNRPFDDPSGVEYTRVYPNPFRDDIKLEFSLARASNVTIQITNALGSVVANCKLDGLEAGQNQWVWDGQTGEGNEVPPGIYILHMRSEDHIITESIRVVRER